MRKQGFVLSQAILNCRLNYINQSFAPGYSKTGTNPVLCNAPARAVARLFAVPGLCMDIKKPALRPALLAII